MIKVVFFITFYPASCLRSWLYFPVTVFLSTQPKATNKQVSWMLNRFFLCESRSLRRWTLIPISFKDSCAVGLIPMNKLHLTFCFPWFSWNLQPIALEHDCTLDSCSFLSCIDENFSIKKDMFLLQPKRKSIKDTEFRLTCSKILNFSNSSTLILMLWYCKKCWYSLNN